MSRPYKEKPNNRFSTIVSTVIIILVLLALFIYGVKEFRAKEPEPEPIFDDISEVMKPSPLLLTLEETTEIKGREKAVLRDATDGKARINEEGHLAFGRAYREDEDGVYFLDVNATLPTIDRQVHFYEVWLLRKLPFEFFSAGEMVTNDLGEFILEFEGDPRGDYTEFSKVIITREIYDDNPDPATHILEGEFVKR